MIGLDLDGELVVELVFGFEFELWQRIGLIQGPGVTI